MFINQKVKLDAKTKKSYINDEEICVRQNAKKLLDKYYESVGHEKGGIGQEALAKMGSLFSSEARKIVILISQELATGILDGTAHAFKRCGHLSPQSEAAQNSLKIFNILIDSLMKQHLQYAVELALSQAPSAEPRQEPDLSLLGMVSEVSCSKTYRLLKVTAKNYVFRQTQSGTCSRNSSTMSSCHLRLKVPSTQKQYRREK